MGESLIKAEGALLSSGKPAPSWTREGDFDVLYMFLRISPISIARLSPYFFFSSVRSSNSHPDLLVIQHPLFQITPVLNTGLSLSEPLQLYKGYNAI